MHVVHPREANNKARKTFTMQYAEGKSCTKKKREKREESIWVNTKCHAKTDRTMSSTLRSDIEKFCYKGWSEWKCSQGWRKHKCLVPAVQLSQTLCHTSQHEYL
jgi:hypothetical protein